MARSSLNLSAASLAGQEEQRRDIDTPAPPNDTTLYPMGGPVAGDPGIGYNVGEPVDYDSGRAIGTPFTGGDTGQAYPMGQIIDDPVETDPYAGIDSWKTWSERHKGRAAERVGARDRRDGKKGRPGVAAGTRDEYDSYVGQRKEIIDLGPMSGTSKSGSIGGGRSFESLMKPSRTLRGGVWKGFGRGGGEGRDDAGRRSGTQLTSQQVEANQNAYEIGIRKDPGKWKTAFNQDKKSGWDKFKSAAGKIAAGIAVVYTGGLAMGAMGAPAAVTGTGATAGMGGMAAANLGAAGSGIVAGGMTTAGAAGLTGALSPALAAVQAGTAASYGGALASGLSGTGVAGGTTAAVGGGGLSNASALTSAPGGGPGIAGSTAGQVGIGGVTGGANMGLLDSVLDYGGQAVDALGGWEGVLGTGLDMAGSYMEGQATAKGNEQAFAAMNPFADYRSKYAGQMDAFMSDPNSITETPGYKFQMEQGMNALNATSAARGTRLSGGAMMEAQRFGQGLAGQMRQQEIQNLSMLSGAAWQPSGGNFKVDSKTAGISGINEALGTLGGVLGYNKGDTSSTDGLVNLIKGLF